MGSWKVTVHRANQGNEYFSIYDANAILAANEVVEVAKECSKQYFYFDLDYDDAEFYGAMERLYAALKKLEEG